MPVLKPRLLLIEDDPLRVELFRSWLAASIYAGEFVFIVATTGGQALGVLKMDSSLIAGICLDHDLNTQQKTESDATTSGSNVVTSILDRVKRHIPILVHSMNTVKGAEMCRRLTAAGFTVDRTRMSILDATKFDRWLTVVADNWN